LRIFVGWTSAEELAKSWVRNDIKARKEVKKLLASPDLTMDAAAAQTLALKIDEIERIDRLIMSTEARRNAVLREVDRHRASVAHGLRQAADNIEDAQFEEFGPSKSWIGALSDQRPQALCQSSECTREHGAAHSCRKKTRCPQRTAPRVEVAHIGQSGAHVKPET
jgi:hypothetical protein